MSSYGTYQSPTGYDTAALPHIPSISNLDRQPYHHDSNALPPMHMRATNAPPFPSSLVRDGADSHASYAADQTSPHVGSSLSHFVPPSHNFSASPALASSQSQMYPPHAAYAPSTQLPSYNNFPSPSSNQGYSSQPSSLPPVNAAVYGQQTSTGTLAGYGTPHTPSSQQFQQDENGVGNVSIARGRRDLLPSESQPPKHTSDTTSAAATNGNITSMKNAEGKFQCTLCPKTYQHQKHLKRHNLRHTGERPYRCHLCHETFCRSDILKRHFAKCSIRRGNPDGITHLTHAQDHLKKRSSESGPPVSDGRIAPPTTGPESDPRIRPSWANDGSAYAHLAAAPQASSGTAAPAATGGSNESSRCSSVLRPSSSGSGSDDKRHYTASHILPRIQAPNSLASESLNYSYGQVYPRSYSNQNQHSGQTGLYGHHANGSNHFTLPHDHSYSQPMSAASYPSMAPVTGAGSDQWMGSSAFDHHGQESLMFSGH